MPPASYPEFPKDKKTVASCATGVQAETVCHVLEEKGYPHVSFLNTPLSIEPDGTFTRLTQELRSSRRAIQGGVDAGIHAALRSSARETESLTRGVSEGAEDADRSWRCR